LQKARKYVEKQYFSGTNTYPSFLSFSDNSLFISKAQAQMQTREWKIKSKVSSSSSTQTKSFVYSFSKLFELVPCEVRASVQKVKDFV